jgi:hypothetical protein
LSEPANLDVLRSLFTNPESLHPGQTSEAVTEQAAELIGQIADGMRVRGIQAHDAAHFLMKLMFSMFAEDIGLLKNKPFAGILKSSKDKPAVLAERMKALFAAMSTGGYFGADEILHFNGGLFADAHVIELTTSEIRQLLDANDKDWSSVEPSIFGSLFERTLDPNKRSQIGAHYTGRADIETLLQPVVMQPLRREWEAVKTECESLWQKVRAASRKDAGKGVQRRSITPKQSPAGKKLEKRLRDFVHRLEDVTILDPACGSGNFLYVALKLLLDLNKEVISYAAKRGINLFPSVRPTQLLGIEINEYAQELASVVIWIGYLQWMHDNGFTPQLDPVLEPFESIQKMDAILDRSDPENLREPTWPIAEFIVGNPPFLGGSRMLEFLGQDYQHDLWRVYDERVSGAADLCCYWFVKGLAHIKSAKCRRVGLLATQAIRGGVNRTVLKKIKEQGDIFFAVSDRDWILDGAMVHVSMIGFDDGSETDRNFDGQLASAINANLTVSVDVTKAKRLMSNTDIAFVGTKKAGKFNIPYSNAREWLNLPNPNCKPNSDVLFPWVNGNALVNSRVLQWIIDTGPDMPLEEFSQYEKPLQWVSEKVKPDRDSNNEARTRDNWWRFERYAPEMRRALEQLPRYFAVVRHAKHRIFVWLTNSVTCDDGIVVFAVADEHSFGILHSRAHEVWALAQGTQVREKESGFRYTPTTCFETFPFPEAADAQREAIATSSKELDSLRNNWLNPQEWTRTEILEFPGSSTGPWRRYIDTATVDNRGIGTVRYPRLVPKDEECAKQLKKRTLTNLYNERPTWLDLAHKKLDAAVFAAYGWSPDTSDDELLALLLALNLERAASQ